MAVQVNKARKQREQLLVSQWVAENYPNARAMFQQRVGPIPEWSGSPELTRSQKQILGSSRRVADAIVFLPGRIILIEGYVHANLGKLSQLLTYKELAPMTPELGEFASLPIAAMLLGAQRDPIMDQMAAKFGISVVIFQPQWMKDYMATLATRFSRDRQHVDLSQNGG
jgi:hypothetical protein